MGKIPTATVHARIDAARERPGGVFPEILRLAAEQRARQANALATRQRVRDAHRAHIRSVHAGAANSQDPWPEREVKAYLAGI
jgi:hypothetical protein